MRFRTKIHFKRFFIAICLITIFGIYLSRYKFAYTSKETINEFGKEEKEIPSKEDDKATDSEITRPSNIKITSSLDAKNCPRYKNDMINVHFILHTHDDPGWLKTSDQYYNDDVKLILQNVIEQLAKNDSRKFVYSEIHYFDKWWKEIDQNKRDLVKKMISNGQLEFVGGGWVQNDDALTHYTASIDQLGYGLRKINQLFGANAKPATSWHIDNFGLSKEQSSIFAQSDYIAEVINRIAYYDKENRRQSKQLEFLWKGDEANSIFTHILFEHYDPPTGFRFENTWGHVPDEITDANINDKFSSFMEVVQERIKGYPTNHLLLLMGNDFVFKNAKSWFDNVDKLIVYGNSLQTKNKINFFYSTPSCYFNAVLNNVQMSNLSTKTDDFFPYVSHSRSYWTGFYSSRPTLKRLVRETNTMLQTLQNFEAVTSSEESLAMLNTMRENFFVTLHHDAITGTCQQHVADDYTRMLDLSLNESQKIVQHIISALTGVSTKFSRCPQLANNYCLVSQSETSFIVVVFNGHSKSRTEYVRIPVQYTDFIVTDGKSKLDIQVVANEDEEKQFSPTLNRSRYELYFPVNLPAVGFSMVHCASKKQAVEADALQFAPVPDGKYFIENEYYKIIFDDGTGFLKQIVNKEHKVSTEIKQSYLWYSNPDAGVYVMRPVDTNWILNNNSKVVLKRREGKLSQEIHQTFNHEITQILRLFKGKKYVEIEWTVGPLMGQVGKEIVTHFSADISNKDTFHTDANGRQLIERWSDNQIIKGVNPQYPIAAKYYPLTSMVAIQDNKVQLSLIPDRPIGGASVKNGTLELLLNRKLVSHDEFGVEQSVVEVENNRPIVVRGKFWLTLTSVESHTNLLWRELAKEMFYSPVVMFSNSSANGRQLTKLSVVDEKALNGVHLLSLQKLNGTHVLIRFENYLPDTKRQVSLKNLLQKKKLSSCVDMFLTGDKEKPRQENTNEITLSPFEIKTFVCSLEM